MISPNTGLEIVGKVFKVRAFYPEDCGVEPNPLIINVYNPNYKAEHALEYVATRCHHKMSPFDFALPTKVELVEEFVAKKGEAKPQGLIPKPEKPKAI